MPPPGFEPEAWGIKYQSVADWPSGRKGKHDIGHWYDQTNSHTNHLTYGDTVRSYETMDHLFMRIQFIPVDQIHQDQIRLDVDSDGSDSVFPKVCISYNGRDRHNCCVESQTPKK
ncbi:hypothetical protein CEXT_808761 [Caerostris extrusa]|uniref:Uncharacterized protein n=1 Tax=Caerostris extrusa TaxID=172846 RepID=A0AAV4PTC2_CAEEX|nr:hypothetical protein CEXT_808761 [Caerostris extrusa]